MKRSINLWKKASTITLSTGNRLYLESQTRARTIQAQTINRARILLLKADGTSIDDIADKVGMNRKSVMLCVNKYLEGGVENALFDTLGRGRNAKITDDEKAWIINIACQKTVNLGYAAEVWTRALLTKYINKFAEGAGHTRLSTISQSKVRTILGEADIKPNKITYYCENRDPDFDRKMHNVLLVYKQLSLQFDKNGQFIPFKEDEQIVHILSYDEMKNLKFMQLPILRKPFNPMKTTKPLAVIININVLEPSHCWLESIYRQEKRFHL